MKKSYKIHKIEEKVAELNAIPTKYPIQPEIVVKYEAIDRIREGSMKHVKKMQEI